MKGNPNEFVPSFVETLVDPVHWYRSTEEHLRECLIGPLISQLRETSGRAPRGHVIVRLSVRYANPIKPEAPPEAAIDRAPEAGEVGHGLSVPLLPEGE